MRTRENEEKKKIFTHPNPLLKLKIVQLNKVTKMYS